MKLLFVLFTICALVFAGVNASEKSDCVLPKEVGPCRKSDFVFYYDSKANECREFIYGGCKGNGNRFDTQADCEKLCKE